MVRKLYSAKYQNTYSIIYYFAKNNFIKDKRTHQTNSGIKQRITVYVYLNGSPYPNAEGSPQLRECLHDANINAAPSIGGKL